MRTYTRRQLLRGSSVAGAGIVLAACQPKVVEKIVKETIEVERVVKETVVVKEAFEVQKEVTRVVEKVATARPAERQPAEVVLMYGRNEISDELLAIFDEKYAPYKHKFMETDLTRLFSMIAAGTPVDVFRIYGTYVPAYVARRVAKDLTDYFEVSTVIPPSDLLPVNELYVVNGRRYGMVKDWSPDYSIFINKSLWEEAGVPIPDPDKSMSLQEWRALAPKLMQKEGDKVLVFGTGWQPNEHVLFWLTTTFDPPEHLFTPDFGQVRLLDNPKVMEFLEFWVSWLQEKTLPSRINPPITGWCGNDWRARQNASILYGYWFSGMAESEKVLGDDILMLPAPTWGPTYSNPCVTGCGALVNAHTRVPDAAWTMFEWFMGEEPAEARAKSGWGGPGIRRLLPLMPTEEPWRKHNFDMVNREIKATKVSAMTWSPYITPLEFFGAWGKDEERLLLGDLPLPEFLKNVEAEVNQAILEGIDRVTT